MSISHSDGHKVIPSKGGREAGTPGPCAVLKGSWDVVTACRWGFIHGIPRVGPDRRVMSM